MDVNKAEFTLDIFYAKTQTSFVMEREISIGFILACQRRLEMEKKSTPGLQGGVYGGSAGFKITGSFGAQQGSRAHTSA